MAIRFIDFMEKLLNFEIIDYGSLRLRAFRLKKDHYHRGCQFPNDLHGFLANESLRFFNMGTIPLTPMLFSSGYDGDNLEVSYQIGSVKKEYDPIKSSTIDKAVVDYACHITSSLYWHFEKLYDFFGNSGGICSTHKNNKGFEKLVSLPNSNNYTELLKRDKFQSSIVWPRLVCGEWVANEAKDLIINLDNLNYLYNEVCHRYRQFHALKKNDFDLLKSDYEKQLGFCTYQQDSINTDSLFSESNGIQRVGSPFAICLEFKYRTTDKENRISLNDKYLNELKRIGPEYLRSLTVNSDFKEVGLAEKVFGTIFSMMTLVSPNDLKSEKMAVNKSIDWLSCQVSNELDKLTTKRFLDKNGGFVPKSEQPKGKRKFMFLRWCEGLSEIRHIIYVCARKLREGGLVPKFCRPAIQSDLIWALIMTDYLQIIINLMQIQTTVAALPFRQIYQGGPLIPVKNMNTVSGIFGISSVALWEYFVINPLTSNPPFSAARNAFQPYALPLDQGGKYTKRWVDPNSWGKWEQAIKSLYSKKTIIFEPLSKLSFPSNLNEDTKSLINQIFRIEGTPRIIDRIARWNRESLPAKKRKEVKGGKRKVIESNSDYRKRLLHSNADDALEFSQSFPIDYERNIPFSNAFYHLPLDGKETSRKDNILQIYTSWGGARTHFVHAAKLESHLQTYVFGWLYKTFISETDHSIIPYGKSPGNSIVFTCACPPYGGKSPPHITHRDGYGFDFSLRYTDEPRSSKFHIAVYWPYEKHIYDSKLKKTYYESIYAKGPTRYKSVRAAIDDYRLALNIISNGNDSKVKLKPLLSELRALQTHPRSLHNELGPFSLSIEDVEKLNIHKAIKKEALLVAWQDHYFDRSDSRKLKLETSKIKKTHIVFREYLRDYVKIMNKKLKEIMYKSQANADNTTNAISTIEKNVDDWPIFPDPASHWSHHFAQLAMILSFPVDVIWASPVYHVRGLRAITRAFDEIKVKNPFSKFESNPGIQQPCQEYQGISDAIHYRHMSIDVPEFIFLPYNHHNHWHINFWKNSKYFKNKYGDYYYMLLSVFPYWRLLGVDMKPFQYYLKMLIKEYSANSKSDDSYQGKLSKTVLSDMKYLNDLIENEYESIVIDEADATAFRTKLLDIIKSDADSHINEYSDRKKWPNSGGVLAHYITVSENLVDHVTASPVFIRNAANSQSIKEQIEEWYADLNLDKEDELDRAIKSEMADKIDINKFNEDNTDGEIEFTPPQESPLTNNPIETRDIPLNTNY